MLAFATTACTKKSNDYVIMLKNHERALHVNAAGKVTAADMSLARKSTNLTHLFSTKIYNTAALFILTLTLSITSELLLIRKIN